MYTHVSEEFCATISNVEFSEEAATLIVQDVSSEILVYASLLRRQLTWRWGYLKWRPSAVRRRSLQLVKPNKC